MASHFVNFGHWLMTYSGAKTTALCIQRYIPFFIEVEKKWGEIPSYEALVSYFHPERLRRVRRIMMWMEKTGLLHVIPQAREYAADSIRITNLLSKYSPHTTFGRLLAEYGSELQKRLSAGKTTIRSIRLALTPAVALVNLTEKFKTTYPTQAILDQYLLESPGQKAAITGFINFLNNKYSLHLIPKVDKAKVRKKRKTQLEKKLIQLTHEKSDPDFLAKWIPIALEYFHNFKTTKQTRSTIMNSEFTRDGDGIMLVLSQQEYFIPLP
ncbi:MULTISPECIES: hypothetical protein [Gynuella]|nr:hypothetical protein [Gynuella sunshinyii]